MSTKKIKAVDKNNDGSISEIIYEDGTREVFCWMCKIDWDHEIGSALGGNTVYPNLEDLKECHSTKGCGIVRVKVTLEEVIEKSNYWNGAKSAQEIKDEDV